MKVIFLKINYLLFLENNEALNEQSKLKLDKDNANEGIFFKINDFLF